jgi:hypothetical protein
MSLAQAVQGSPALLAIKCGQATMAAATVTIADANVTANSIIIATLMDGSAATGPVVVTRNAGVSFVITAAGGGTSKVSYAILKY